MNVCYLIGGETYEKRKALDAVEALNDTGTPSIQRYNGLTGVFVDDLITGDGLAEPMSLAFGPDGSLKLLNLNPKLRI